MTPDQFSSELAKAVATVLTGFDFDVGKFSNRDLILLVRRAVAEGAEVGLKGAEAAVRANFAPKAAL
jgi:hypothetical protein